MGAGLQGAGGWRGSLELAWVGQEGDGAEKVLGVGLERDGPPHTGVSARRSAHGLLCGGERGGSVILNIKK